MELFKNTSGQKVRVFAFADSGHATLDAGAPVTGDAANITAQTAVDNAALGASNDVNPAEVDATNAAGVYEFDPTQAESNGDVIEWYAKSSTAGVQVVTVGGSSISTRPANWPDMGIESDGHVHSDLKQWLGVAPLALTSQKVQSEAQNMRGTDNAALASVATETRLAELDAANLPADVDTLKTRITSTLFNGITSMAEWLGLMAGKQTGDATARTEIRATGAGSGTYDETADSQEAIRDSVLLASSAPTNFGDLAIEVTTGRVQLQDGTSTGQAGWLVDAVWDEVLTGATHNVATSAGRRLRELGAVSIRSGTAQAGASNSITLDSGASATDHIYDNNLVVITAGTGAGQSRVIVHYDGTTKVATVDLVWQTNPDGTSEFQIIADHQASFTSDGLAQAGSASTITLSNEASAQDDIYNGQTIFLTTSTGTGQSRLITDYNGTTKVATVSPDWDINPTSSSVYKIVPGGRVVVEDIATDAVNEIRNAITGGTYPLDTEASGRVRLASGTAPGEINLSNGLVTISETTGVGNTIVTTGNLNLSSGVAEANAKQINGNASAAAQLAKSAGQIISGTVNDTTTTPSTTQFAASDITEATDDHYNGRIVIFTSGALAGQATDITDYTTNGAGEGLFTVTAITEAPADGVTFVIV